MFSVGSIRTLFGVINTQFSNASKNKRNIIKYFSQCSLQYNNHTYLKNCNKLNLHLCWKELPRVDRAQDPVEGQKSQRLSFQKIYLNFAVFLSKFIKTYIFTEFQSLLRHF